MKKKIKITEIFFLMLVIIIPISCTGKNINMTDKERLLKERVQEFNNIMDEGKLRKLYNLIYPQTRTDMKEGWKNYLLSLGDDQIVEDFKLNYKTESIKIDNDIGTVISYVSYPNIGDGKPIKIYHYWCFTDNNWYLMEFDRTEPASEDFINRYRKLIHSDQK